MSVSSPAINDCAPRRGSEGYIQAHPKRKQDGNILNNNTWIVRALIERNQKMLFSREPRIPSFR